MEIIILAWHIQFHTRMEKILHTRMKFDILAYKHLSANSHEKQFDNSCMKQTCTYSHEQTHLTYSHGLEIIIYSHEIKKIHTCMNT